MHHPLCKRTLDTSVAAWKHCEAHGLLGENADEDLIEMVSEYQITGAKLAGALDSLAYGEDLHDPGFIVALLKRALDFLNKSMKAAEKVADKQLLGRQWMAEFRKEQFDIREEILRLMERFRGKRRSALQPNRLTGEAKLFVPEVPPTGSARQFSKLRK